jgi:hypothetical protein
VGGEERLDRKARRLERVLLGARQATGVPTGWVDPEAAAGLVEEGLARLEDGRLVPTDRGMLLANEVVLAAT